MNRYNFVDRLREHKIEISTEQMDRFFSFYNILNEENDKYNLTSITSEEGVYEKHFFDSISILFDGPIVGNICDLGSGCGMPGLPLKIMQPNLDITYLDSNRKKTSFIELVSNKLNIQGKYLNCRSEECNIKFDNVIARGVAPLNILLEIVLSLLKENSTFIAMKGSSYKDELDLSKNAMTTLGYDLIKIQEYILPDENIKRYNLYFRKNNKFVSKYPRNYSQIKKKPL